MFDVLSFFSAHDFLENFWNVFAFNCHTHSVVFVPIVIFMDFPFVFIYHKYSFVWFFPTLISNRRH